MKIFKSILFKYLLVIFVAFLFDVFFNEISKGVFLNLIENILFAFIFVSIHYLSTNKTLNKVIFVVLFFIFSTTVFIETVYYYLFQTTFNSSTVFVILDSNSNESIEFAEFYINKPIVIFGVLILIVIIQTFLSLKHINFKQIKTFKIKVIGLILAILVFLKLSSLIIYNLPYMTVRAGVEYFNESKKLGEYVNDKYGNFNNVHRELINQEKEIYVFIIGESTSRLHLGLYDYYRNTTPLLKEIKDELLIYKDVISPDTYTIASLTKALTLGNYENPNAKYDGSIIQLLNQAKFKTYWISNQKPIGTNESHVTKLALGADKTFFLNIKRTNEKTVLDIDLIKKMNEVLLEEGDKKVIFLHTLGTHFNYRYRYPEGFNYFDKDIPKTKFKKQDIYDEINAYDNAVRYTDYVVRNVIETVRKLETSSVVLYFSDHGEEVYDSIEFSGHLRDKLQTKNVYEIPMVLWYSDKYSAKKEIFPNLGSKYMIDDLFHSIADLTGVDANEVDSTRSIFSRYFKERNRIVKDSINYDLHFTDKL